MLKLRPSDTAFSLWIRSRDDWTCQRCFRVYTPPTAALHCSHFIGRRKENTRFEPLNADALCFGCHQYFTSHPLEHLDWQISRKGQALVDKLRLAGNTYKKRDDVLEGLYWRQRLQQDFGL